MEDYREDIAIMLERKKDVRDLNTFDMPITKDRFYYSFIWDRFTFYEADNIGEMVRIDPTDLKLNFAEELKKLLKKQATNVKPK